MLRSTLASRFLGSLLPAPLPQVLSDDLLAHAGAAPFPFYLATELGTEETHLTLRRDGRVLPAGTMSTWH